VPRQHDVVRDLVLYPFAELFAIAAVVVGVRRYRPAAPAAWLLIAAGFFSYWVGDVVWGARGRRRQRRLERRDGGRA
jgi:hypothetical protein